MDIDQFSRIHLQTMKDLMIDFIERRDFLKGSLAATAAAMIGGTATGLRACEAKKVPMGKADHCIMIWLGGGMAQIDTFDPKAVGDAKERKAGAYYPSIPTAVQGVEFCEHLKKTANVADRLTVMRTVNHPEIDEHAAATNRVHTGRPTSGNIIYPSIGSIVAHQRGAAGDGVPGYVLMGYPSASRGPGFLGAKYNPIYLLDTKSGPAGFTHPDDVTHERLERRQQLLSTMRKQADGSAAIANYDQVVAESQRLSGPQFMSAFDLEKESASLRNEYGGEFGQRCLLSRRLIERGVRFIEVSHNLNFLNGTGWDTHNEGQVNQHLLIQELDTAFSALVADLEEKKLFDRTLIVIATEFGRPPEFDGGGGRGHQGSAFSMVLAGGGLKHVGAYGVTDEKAKKIVEKPVPVADFHATVHATLRVDPTAVLYDASRPVPITDEGQVVGSLFG